MRVSRLKAGKGKPQMPTGSPEKQLEKLMETSAEAQLGLPKPGALSIVFILPLKKDKWVHILSCIFHKNKVKQNNNELIGTVL